MCVRFPIRPALAVAAACLAIAGGGTAMSLAGPVRDAAVAVPQFSPPASTVPATPSPSVIVPTTTPRAAPATPARPTKKRQPPRRTTPRATTTAKPAPVPQPAPTPQRLSARAGDVGAKVRAQVRPQAAQPVQRVPPPRPFQQFLRTLLSRLRG